MIQGDLFRALPALPEPPKGKYPMRPYQQAADHAIDAALDWSPSTLLVLATGCGKTVSASEQARKRGGVLFLAHRDALLKQAAQKLRHHIGADVAIEKAEREAYETPYIVASVQSLRGDRLTRFAKKHQIGFIITDECHRAPAKSYRDVYAAFPDAKHLGLSATPQRADGVGLWTVYERAETPHGAAFQYDMRQAIDECWLTDFDYRPVFAPIDLGRVKVQKTGDLDAAQLNKLVAEQAGEIAKALIDSCRGRTLGFTTGVESAEVTAAALNRLRPGCARSVHGLMADDEKAAIERGHQRGDFEFLINCAVYIEGYDDPGLINVFDAALTKSVGRHAQKMGRGTRLYHPGFDFETADLDARRRGIASGPKPRWNYYHLNGIGDRHDLTRPTVDLLAGTATDDERKVACEILRAKGGSVDDALSEARARLEEERARLATIAAREAAVRKTKVGDHRNPFTTMGVSSFDDSPVFEPASAAQERRLRELGVPVPAGLTKRQASRLIGAAQIRNKKGLANYDQLRQLGEMGIAASPRMYANTAASIIRAHREKETAKEKRWAVKNWGEVAPREVGQEG